MRILVIGEHFSNNLGDGIISECFCYILQKYNIEYTLLDISGRMQPQSQELHSECVEYNLKNRIKNRLGQNIFLIYARNIVKLGKLRKYYLDILKDDFDIAMYDGGSIFMGYFAMRMLMLNTMLSKKNTRIYYHACGMGKFDFLIDKIILKKAISLRNIKEISLRDSHDLFVNSFRRDVINTADVGLLSSIVYKKYQTHSSVDIIGIGCINLTEDFNKCYYNSVRNLIIDLEKRELQWELFTNGAPEDYKKMIIFYNELQKMGLSKFGSFSKKSNKTNELIETITKYKRIISCRLHSAIVAYSFFIPTFAIGWSAKISHFYKMINHEDFVLSPYFDSNYIIDKLLQIEYNEIDKNKLLELQRMTEKGITRMIYNV